MKFNNQIFKNRDEAADLLYEELPTEAMQQEEWIILAISTGAVPIALSLSNKLNATFDYLFTKKIFTKKNNECEVAIITETQEIVIHEELMSSFSLDLEDLYAQSKEVYSKAIKKYKHKYRNNLDIIDLENKNVLLVDEGLNTGLTMMACIKSVINEKAKSICVAVPVLPEVTINDIEAIADDLYYIQAPAHFISIDFYYETLEELNLEDIEKLKTN
ncbi:MAG: phosphoribosyltransferase family protein [Campylobacterota bacterium]|nr:phosphoribosyltransferase family protein [Campylobacterota bacterium]